MKKVLLKLSLSRAKNKQKKLKSLFRYTRLILTHHQRKSITELPVFSKLYQLKHGIYLISMDQTLYAQNMLAFFALIVIKYNYLCPKYSALHMIQGIITKEYQKQSKNSISAQVVAFLAVVTLIKDCYKIQKSHSNQTIFSHFIGPTGLLNTKVL